MEVAMFSFPFSDFPFVVFGLLSCLQGLLSGGNAGNKVLQMAFENFVLFFLPLILLDLEEVENFILLGETRPGGVD
jgi:hypothetical protein